MVAAKTAEGLLTINGITTIMNMPSHGSESKRLRAIDFNWKANSLEVAQESTCNPHAWSWEEPGVDLRKSFVKII